MKIVIDPPFATFFEEQVKSGNYDTAEEVVKAGLARLRTEAGYITSDLEDLRAEVKVGVDEAERGDFAEFTADDIIKEGREILAKRHKAV